MSLHQHHTPNTKNTELSILTHTFWHNMIFSHSMFPPYLTLCFLLTYTSHTLFHHASFHCSKLTLVRRSPNHWGGESQFQHTPKMPVHQFLERLMSRSIYYDLLSMLIESIWIQGANRLLQGLDDRIKDRRNRRWKTDMENSLSNFLTTFFARYTGFSNSSVDHLQIKFNMKFSARE